MYDVIIVGCGPAGMTAAIYARRANKKVLILEKESIGGQMALAPTIENYPGFSSITGNELASNMYEQMMNLDINLELEEVINIKNSKIKQVITDSNTYKTKSIIIASGGHHRILGLENENELLGHGVHYCASCDGAFYKDKVVAVVGGGNGAVGSALMLSNICKKVYVIHRSKAFSAERVQIEKLMKQANVEIMLETKVTKIIGKEELEEIEIQLPQEKKILELNGLFISIGHSPESGFAQNLLEINEKGFILSKDGTTNVEGIFVAGDCRLKDVRQITTAIGDGTIAAMHAIQYLNEC